jgi:hypothetical protein
VPEAQPQPLPLTETPTATLALVGESQPDTDPVRAEVPALEVPEAAEKLKNMPGSHQPQRLLKLLLDQKVGRARGRAKTGREKAEWMKGRRARDVRGGSAARGLILCTMRGLRVQKNDGAMARRGRSTICRARTASAGKRLRKRLPARMLLLSKGCPATPTC